MKATENAVIFSSEGDVVLMDRAEQNGGSPKLKVGVNGDFTVAPAQAITNSGAPAPYTFDVNAPSGSGVKIGVKAANTGSGRHPFLDYATFPPAVVAVRRPIPTVMVCQTLRTNAPRNPDRRPTTGAR